jgi:GcrA cell cycle regulator
MASTAVQLARSWWNGAAARELERLWASGLPASEMAERLGTTKNAVIGKARRLGLPYRAPHGEAASARRR